MITTQTQHGFLQQVMIALFCLVAVVTVGFLILDQGRGPYHAAPVPEHDIGGAEQILPASLVAGATPLTPAEMLHRMQADGAVDMAALIEQAVKSFDGTDKDHTLRSYLVWAISAEKSDAYIDSLLNSAAARGHFKPPDALLTQTGRLDTASLLSAIQLAQNPPKTLAHVAPAASLGSF